MSHDMSLQYLLTLIGDRLDDLDNLMMKLKEQDKEHTAWGDKGMETLKQGLIWMKDKVGKRLDEVLEHNGKDPTEYLR